jgi:alkanesulfonate monooxygenase SsuD/methylene tetrahydromethanopterin reductase-like flavin-dependent oxidoreductase (luciferase family)
MKIGMLLHPERSVESVLQQARAADEQGFDSVNPETPGRVLAEPDWPRRPMTLVRNAWIFVAETESAAVQQATDAFRAGGVRGELEDFPRNNVIGAPEQCVHRLREMHTWGINYVRAAFARLGQQEAAGRLLLPLVQQSEEQMRV